VALSYCLMGNHYFWRIAGRGPRAYFALRHGRGFVRLDLFKASDSL